MCVYIYIYIQGHSWINPFEYGWFRFCIYSNDDVVWRGFNPELMVYSSRWNQHSNFGILGGELHNLKLANQGLSKGTNFFKLALFPRVRSILKNIRGSSSEFGCNSSWQKRGITMVICSVLWFILSNECMRGLKTARQESQIQEISIKQREALRRLDNKWLSKGQSPGLS